jgi:hypothetical protein
MELAQDLPAQIAQLVTPHSAIRDPPPIVTVSSAILLATLALLEAVLQLVQDA